MGPEGVCSDRLRTIIKVLLVDVFEYFWCSKIGICRPKWKIAINSLSVQFRACCSIDDQSSFWNTTSYNFVISGRCNFNPIPGKSSYLCLHVFTALFLALFDNDSGIFKFDGVKSCSFITLLRFGNLFPCRCCIYDWRRFSTFGISFASLERILFWNLGNLFAWSNIFFLLDDCVRCTLRNLC